MAMPDFNLNGKVALITGAARGIGLAIAQALGAAGCLVAIQDIDEQLARDEADKLKGLGLGGDLADLSIADQLIASTVRKLGGFHILINNGAIQSRRHWSELATEEVDRILRANVHMPLRLSQLAAPIMKRQRWGRIVNVGSIQQVTGNPRMLPYSMSKAALENMTTALAGDLGPDGITVNLIAPGYFDTLRNKHQIKNEEDKERAGQGMALRRMGEPEDVAGLALVLCSNAGSYITGQSIHVNGGMRLW